MVLVHALAALTLVAWGVTLLCKERRVVLAAGSTQHAPRTCAACVVAATRMALNGAVDASRWV